MTRAFIIFYYQLLKYNFLFSFSFTVFSVMGGYGIKSLLSNFLLSFSTLGFLVAVLVFELRNKNQYYFYYNKGLSKTQLIVWALAINLLTGYTLIKLL